jgi:hypothetical protein
MGPGTRRSCAAVFAAGEGGSMVEKGSENTPLTL